MAQAQQAPTSAPEAPAPQACREIYFAEKGTAQLKYPDIPSAAHISGNVLLHFQIQADGTPSGVEALSGPVLLQRDSKEIVKMLRFRPIDKACEMSASFRYQLDNVSCGDDVAIHHTNINLHDWTLDVLFEAPGLVVCEQPGIYSSIFRRWAQYYRQDWHQVSPDPNAPLPAAPPAAATRNGTPPVDSPPFPISDWPYGGSQDIGAPDGNVYPLMTAINGARSRTKIYGWIEPGVNGSTSSHTNFPEAYDVYSNRVELDQAVVYVERLADTVQTAHFDIGYHLTAFFGTDYRFTTGKGYFSQQLLQRNQQYGFDPQTEYADFYFPRVGQGMDVRLGRFISVPGIEAPPATGNYMYSHSLLNAFDPVTDTGAMATIRFSKQWLLQLGLTDGHDVAPWTSDATPSGTLCLNYTTASTSDNFYACANGINDGKYRYNNLQQFDGTWWHRFSKTVHMGTESWYMYERDVPNVAGNVANPVPLETGTTGAFCQRGQQRCTAPEYAIVNYINKEFSPQMYLSFRSDFVDDKKGQRTGFATRYGENTLMLNKNFGTTVTLRPELRFEHAYDAPAYNAGRAHSQFTVAADLIYRF